MKDFATSLLFALKESQALGHAIVREAQIPPAALEEITFPEGEFKLRALTSVRHKTAYVVQTLGGSSEAPVAHRLLRLLFMLFALRDAVAVREQLSTKIDAEKASTAGNQKGIRH
jgi:phosphoribosylpyrophosphate synthetase